jgi:hypothetical protein
MRRFYKNWKKLNWFGRILSIPGLLVVGVVMLIISPIIIVCMAIGYTMDVLGYEPMMDFWEYDQELRDDDFFKDSAGYEP